MEKFRLGKTALFVTHTGFGALPVQRVTMEESDIILRRAYEAGINYFDTARAYTDSEEKIGHALADVRESIFIATKTAARTAEGFWKDLATSLAKLKTDVIDVYQFHNPPFVPRPGGADGLYDAALEAKRQGKIRYIGITQHSIDRAFEAAESGLYDTLQYPFNHLASERDVALVELCRDKQVGFICMKALSGGLITDAAVAYAFLARYDHIVPIWGIQRVSELEEIIGFTRKPPQDDAAMQARIERDRRELAGAFCRSCGYCMPCPVGINIAQINRLTQLLTRSPAAPYFTPEWAAQVELAKTCVSCGECAKKCPYGLKPYETMPAHIAFYEKMRAQRKAEQA